MTRNELCDLLNAAIVEWAEGQRMYRGDNFATATEMESIHSDPLGFSDLLPRDALDFVRRVLSIQQQRDDLAADLEAATYRRGQIFETADGYKLRYADGKWTDGDLDFADDQRLGWPVTEAGDLLQGGTFTAKKE